jgi:hypothetical protein
MGFTNKFGGRYQIFHSCDQVAGVAEFPAAQFIADVGHADREEVEHLIANWGQC